MRSTSLLVLIVVLSLQDAAAREIPRPTIPDEFLGTWAPSAEPCKEGDRSAIVLSPKEYAGPIGICGIETVIETPGRDAPIYSARMLCSSSGAQAQKNLIIRPEGSGQMSVGPTFEGLVAHRRCPASVPPAKP